MRKSKWLAILAAAAMIAAIPGCGSDEGVFDVLDSSTADVQYPDTVDPDIDQPFDANRPDLNGADLNGIDLAGYDLNGVDLGDFELPDKDTNVDQDGTDIGDPDGTEPDGVDPDAIDPDGQNPDVNDPDATDPDAVDPDANHPDVVNPDNGGGDTGGDTTVEPTECGNPPIPDVASGNCSFTEGSNYLLLRGDVFGRENILKNAMVLIDPTGFITCAACDCTGATGYAGATVIACPDALITPGLINGHDHVTFGGNAPKPHTVKYDHRHEWRTGKVPGKPKISVPSTSGAEPWTELRHIVGGATSMFGSGSAQGLLRNLDRELMDIPSTYQAKYDTFPLDDTDGTMLTSGCQYPGITTWSSVSSFKSYVPHISEGINLAANNEFKCLSDGSGGGQDLVRENSGIIHGIGLTAGDIAQMAIDGTGLIWSVRTNIDLYGNTASITLFDKLGVDIGIGPDWTASGSMNMMRELNCVDYLNRNHFNGHFSDWRIVEMATAGNARVFNLLDKIGQLKPGLLADIAIFSTASHPAERAIIDGNPGDVIMTMRSGIPLYGDANLVDGLLPGDAGCEALSVCGISKKVCAKRETGTAFATLQAAGGYALFFCGVPDNEPSCQPSRPGEYNGVTSDDDDGDGVADGVDNCPLVFNPIRPMDGGRQPDVDDDGVGDVCDPCPFDADTTECTGFNADDVDGDGIPNDIDNCPRDSNENQENRDFDDKGDICDECPDDANFGSAACPATVWDVKSGVVQTGSKVALSNLIVTAVAMNGTKLTGFFAQEDPASPGYQGIDQSGIYVYAPSLTPIPAVGAVVSFTGTVTVYFGQIQMTSISGMVIGATTMLPEPELAEPDQVMTGGARAEQLEGVLVEVQDVTVTSITPPVGGGDKAPTNEFVVDNGVRVNDFIHLIQPFPAVDDQFTSIVGVLRLANDNFKIEPRSADDINAVTPDLMLTGVSPLQAWIPWGDPEQATFPAFNVHLNRKVLEGETPQIEITTSIPDDLWAFASPVTIPVGQKSAEVIFSSSTPRIGLLDVDVCAKMGSQEVCNVVTLVAPSFTSSITSTEPVSPAGLTVGSTMTVQVNLDVPVMAEGTTVTIDVVDPAVVSAPALAEVVVGELFTTFTIEGLAEGETTINLAYGESTASIVIQVTDQPQTSNVMIAEVFYDPSGTDSGYEWVKLYNAGAAGQDLTGWSLANGGTSWTVAKWSLSGVIPAGGCMIIGGPLANDGNGNPSYDLLLDFNPDLQNSGPSGEAADGVALFNVTADAITAASIPVDVVIYGYDNLNGLVGPDGNVAPVNVGDAPSNSSIAMTDDGVWTIRATPTPGVCPPW